MRHASRKCTELLPRISDVKRDEIVFNTLDNEPIAQRRSECDVIYSHGDNNGMERKKIATDFSIGGLFIIERQDTELIIYQHIWRSYVSINFIGWVDQLDKASSDCTL